ncbi:diguanylate cyclase [Luteimonas sp. XNQY3]|nr:diguanylate cyclase [Luteimonas sp. XNQY3]
MPYYDDNADRSQTPALRFVTRIHRMRMLGTLLCAVPIASVLHETGAPMWIWVALIFNALVWPHVAWLLARRARDPAAVEYRSLVVDAAAGGVWIAIIGVNLLPSAVLLTVLSADRFAAGGWRLLSRALPAMLAGFAVAWLALGRPFAPDTSLRTMIACLPLMFGYQFALSVVTWRLGRTIARQNRELERATRTDDASDLPNRRHFDGRAAHAFKLFQRSGRQAALLLIDIDQFKTTNDRYGHGMGDVVVRRVGDVLRDIATGDDVPARFGGDEFALLLTSADRELALSIAERVRIGVSGLTFEAEPGLACTVSVGLAETRSSHATLADWIRDADAALYRAKAAGRDRVQVG